MGRLTFGNGARVDFDDRTVAHLNAVIGAKLRRGESFHLTWSDDKSIGNGRTTIWVHPELAIVCKLNGQVGPLDPRWIDALMVSANSVSGLRVVPEPAQNGRGR